MSRAKREAAAAIERAEARAEAAEVALREQRTKTLVIMDNYDAAIAGINGRIDALERSDAEVVGALNGVQAAVEKKLAPAPATAKKSPAKKPAKPAAKKR